MAKANGELDPMSPLMTLGITEKILGMTDCLPELAAYLTQEIREMTSARLVILYQFCNEPDGQPHCILSVSPNDMGRQIHSPELMQVLAISGTLENVTVWSNPTDGAAAEVLHDSGYGLPSIVIPLWAGNINVGQLLALGLNEPVSPVLRERLTHLMGIVALALRNSSLVCEQEAIIRTRTAELRESESRFHSLFDDVPNIAVQGYTPDGTIRYWNKASEAVYGYAAEEAIGQNFLKLIIPAELRSDMQDAITRSLLTGDPPAPGELELLHRDGDRVPVCASHVLITRSGKEPEFFCIGINLRERRDMEERLRQSEKMDAIGQLAGGVAHDFNNQLAAILGFAELLYHRLEEPAVRNYAENILKAASQSSELTQQLLAFSRKGNYRAVAVNTEMVIKQVVKLLEHSIDKRIRLRWDFAAEPCYVEGDPVKLQNAILNLALNARDAMPQGGDLAFATSLVDLSETACCALSEDVEPGTYVKISIADTGIGMDAATKNRIFEPFFTTKDNKGTGLGLPAVYGAACAHGGSIEVESAPGLGSTFNMYLPAMPKNTPVCVAEEPQDYVTSERSAHILLVDDEETVRTMAVQVLEELGHSVITAATGKEAAEIYARDWRKFDLVLLDMVMPELSGRDTYRRLSMVNPQVKVLLASGYTLDEEAKAILQEGSLDFVQKPFTLTEISKKISEVLAI